MQLLEELSELCGNDRPIQVARELTKVHEQQIGPTIEKALQHFLINKPQGECTLVLGGANSEKPTKHTHSELISELKILIKDGATPSEAAKSLAKKSGESRRAIYDLWHKSQTKKNTEISEEKINEN